MQPSRELAPEASHRRRRHSLRATQVASMVAVLVAVNFTAPSLFVSAAVLPRSRWVTSPGGGRLYHDTSCPDRADRAAAARAAAVGLRCGATSGGSSNSEEGAGDGADEAPPPPTEKSALAAKAKEVLSKLKAKGVLSNVMDVVSSLLPGKGAKSSSSGSGGGKAKGKKAPKSSKKSKKSSSGGSGGGFTEAFEAKYGKSHPKFNEKSFSDATEAAWSRNRLCLVYIPPEKGAGGKAIKVGDAICKALTDPEVAEFVDSNFVMWAPGGGKGSAASAASAAVAKRVGARSLPFLGVVHSTSTTDKMTLERTLERSTVAMHHCNPPPSAGQMVSWMSRVKELKKGLLEVELAEQQRLKEEDTIYTERVEGYSKSLKDDALREVREREEEAERARLEEEERMAQEALEAKEREDVERRERKATELGQEPPESAVKGAEATAATIMLRLGDGSRVRRRFLRTDRMGKVLDWADVQGVDLGAQRLSSTLPKASFSCPGDSEVTIEEAGLGKQALLFVEQKPKEPTQETAGEAAAVDAADSEEL